MGTNRHCFHLLRVLPNKPVSPTNLQGHEDFLKKQMLAKVGRKSGASWEGAALTPSDHAPRTFCRYTLWGSEGESFEFSLFTLGPFCPPHAQEGHFLLPDNVNNGRAVSRRGGGATRQNKASNRPSLLGTQGQHGTVARIRPVVSAAPMAEGRTARREVQQQEGETGSLS